MNVKDMKKKLFSSLVWGAAFAMLTLNACTNEVTQSLPEEQPDGDIKEVVFIAAGFDEDHGVQSRVDYTIGKDENEVKKAFFAWALGDTIGTFSLISTAFHRNILAAMEQ